MFNIALKMTKSGLSLDLKPNKCGFFVAPHVASGVANVDAVALYSRHQLLVLLPGCICIGQLQAGAVHFLTLFGFGSEICSISSQCLSHWTATILRLTCRFLTTLFTTKYLCAVAEKHTVDQNTFSTCLLLSLHAL